MRILQVRFKNLNSLMGEWLFDFTHSAYVSDGIFAITGPTGAGKTTILDAICLALYGSTPRLSRVTKSGNEIMSRQTGECFAEVAFETRAGRFRCHWSQHRARRKPGGELQPPKHEIADADSGQVLESRLRDVAERIENVTGMDFERFTRSMLLAQGGFAAFLQAAPDERAPILEQITGTQIYSDISRKVHERRSLEHSRLDVLQSELAGMHLLSEADECELHGELSAKRKQEAECSHKLQVLRDALAWLEKISLLETEAAVLDGQWQAFEEELQAFQPELKRLERGRKALSVEGDYVKVCALREQQARETEELSAVRAQLPGQESLLAEALQARQAAFDQLEQARNVQKREAQVIKQVREMDVKLADKGAQLDAARESITQAAARRSACLKQMEADEVLLKQSQAMREGIESYLSEHVVDASLVTNIAAIEKMFEAFRERDARHVEAREALTAASAGKEAAHAACAEQALACEKARVKLSRAEEGHQQRVDEIRGLLGERDAGQWRDALDGMQDRRRLLEQTAERLARVDARRRELSDLREHHQSLGREKVRLLEDVKVCSGEKAHCECNAGHLERQVALLNRIRDLEAERLRLEDGKPCPLCGATAHPYAEGNVPEVDAAESALKGARDECKVLADRLAALRVRQAEVEKDIGQARRDTERREASLAEDEAACAVALASLRIEAVCKERLIWVQDALAALRERIAGIEGTLAEAQRKGKEEKAAGTSLEKLRAAFAEAETALREASHKRETAVRDHERRAAECAAAAKQAEKAGNEALQGVRVYGIEAITVAGLDGLREGLTRRRDEWQAGQDDKVRHEKAIAVLRSELEKKAVLVDKLDEELQSGRKAHESLMKALDVLRAERRKLYGDKDADEEEKRLTDAVGRAENELERIREDYGRIEKNVSRLKATIESLSGSTAKRCQALTEAERELAARLKQAGFEDEADYSAAHLPEATRNRLSLQAESLQRRQTELETRRRDKHAVFKIEREKRVTEQPRDRLQRDLLACESELKDLQQAIGAIRQRLSENEDVRARQQERVKLIDAQKKECLRWDALHQLIGSADGKKYRNFAQGLTFEMMVAHANRQLRKMTERYLLVRDDTQPLELNVIDDYQAGEIRSTKNLSGGESFIVSLALALGLSHMASRNVRVDSLFLDEGFGTLDEDALETALETLAGLRQEGKLIGVISHVAALRERIGTQIRVHAEPGGRGGIRGPGCKRVVSGSAARA